MTSNTKIARKLAILYNKNAFILETLFKVKKVVKLKDVPKTHLNNLYIMKYLYKNDISEF